MSSRTHGDWFGRDEGRDEDDTPTDVHPRVQRPISVAALLKREGHDGPSQEGMTRRTLTGVAAGAVMVFSAAVGSLLLHHSDTPTGTVAGSANGDVLAADGAIAGTSSTPAAGQQSLPTSTYTTTTPAAAAPKANTNVAPKAVTHARTSTNVPAASQAPVATTSQAPATSTAPATTAAPSSSGSSATSTPSSTAGNASSSSSSSTSTSTTTSSNGGLLGTVTGTVTGVLSGVNNVTNSAFSWFGN